MSDDSFALVELLTCLALIAVLILRFRQGKSTRRLLQSLEASGWKLHPKLEPPTLDEALARIIQQLQTAEKLLAEVYGIGVWVKSDDSSDNRNRRRLLRETDWAVSDAHRRAEPFAQGALETMERDLKQLVKTLEPLPDTIPDTMADNDPARDAQITALRGEVARLLAEATRLAERGLP